MDSPPQWMGGPWPDFHPWICLWPWFQSSEGHTLPYNSKWGKFKF